MADEALPPDSDSPPLRVLVLAPTGRDAPLITRVVERAGIAAVACGDIADLCRRWDGDTGAAIVAEEALSPVSLTQLSEALARQPAWSDLPVIVLTGGGKTTRFSTRVVERLAADGNVTLLERPLRMLTLVSGVRSALRARRRQFEVRRLLEETQRGVRQRDEFLATLGHELRNPLAAICSAVAVVTQSNCEDKELVAEQAGIIARQSANVRRLVDDLLDVARVTAGKITLDRRPTDLRQVAANALRTVQLADGVKRHEVVFASPAGPVTVSGDAVRLEQVATNLLTNALRYTPQGGKVWLAVRREEGEAVLSVRDTGEGIPSDALPHIFDPFVQSDQPLARSRGGLGIGLTVVRGLVRMHGGTIAAASNGPGRGSEFVVRLPLATTEAPLRDAAADAGGGASRRVLLVEDNADARRSMQRLLKLWGHQVEVAGDGTAGVEKALSSFPQVMVVDIGLPDIDGYEVARRVREKLGGAVRLVALTGYGQPDDSRRAMAAGFDLHLVKPVALDKLRAALNDPAA